MSLYTNIDAEITVGDTVRRSNDRETGTVVEIEGGRHHASVTVDWAERGRWYEFPDSLYLLKETTK